MKPVFICDVDGVLAEIDAPTLARINDTFGTSYRLADLTHWHAYDDLLSGLVDDPQAWLRSVWGDPRFMAAQPLILPSLIALRRIGGIADVHIVTARDAGDRYQEATKAWLDEYGIPYRKLVFRQDKWNYARDQKARWIAEDSAHQARECLDRGVGVFLVDRPYNQDVAPRGGLWRIESLIEAVPVVEEEAKRS